jgi:hypothetical protein
MASREYLREAGEYMRRSIRHRTVKLKQHDIETSMLEGLLTRGDRRIAAVLEGAWRKGARLDGWRECFDAERWWSTVRELNVDFDWYVHRHRPTSEVLPWDHINVKKGRAYLEKEQNRSLMQLEVMAKAT